MAIWWTELSLCHCSGGAVWCSVALAQTGHFQGQSYMYVYVIKEDMGICWPLKYLLTSLSGCSNSITMNQFFQISNQSMLTHFLPPKTLACSISQGIDSKYYWTSKKSSTLNLEGEWHLDRWRGKEKMSQLMGSWWGEKREAGELLAWLRIGCEPLGDQRVL